MKPTRSERNFFHNCFSKDPPLLIFIASLSLTIVSFLLLALYIHLVHLPAWELNHKWNKLTMGLGHQTFCLDTQHHEDQIHHCSSSNLFQFSIKAQVEVKRSLFDEKDFLAFYSCFNRLHVATDIDNLSIVKNTYFSLSLNVPLEQCEPANTVCKFESDVCVGVNSTDDIIFNHLDKLETIPRPPKCVTTAPTSHTHLLLPTILHPNVSMCEQAQIQPLLQPSNNWELSRIFKDAFPLINLSLTQQDKTLAARHLFTTAVILFLAVLSCGIAYIIRAFFVYAPKK